MSDLKSSVRGVLLPDPGVDHTYVVFDHVLRRARLVVLGDIVQRLEMVDIASDSPEDKEIALDMLDMLGIGQDPDFDIIMSGE